MTIDASKTSPEKLAEMNDSLIADNQYLRGRIIKLDRDLEARDRVRDAIPEGFVLVPKEPTSFMKYAMCSVTLDDKEYQFCYDLCWEEATELYKAAIAAAQKP